MFGGFFKKAEEAVGSASKSLQDAAAAGQKKAQEAIGTVKILM